MKKLTMSLYNDNWQNYLSSFVNMSFNASSQISFHDNDTRKKDTYLSLNNIYLYEKQQGTKHSI